MRRYALTTSAERDLDQIKHYLINKGGARIARKVITEIRTAIRLLSAEPEIGHTRSDLTERPVKFWPVYSYLIVYDPNSKPLHVLRILHGARDATILL